MWLLIVGLVVGAGLVWLVVMDSRRREAEVDAVERPREAAWLSAVLAEDGVDVSPEAAERLLQLHRAYLEAHRRRRMAPFDEDGERPVDGRSRPADRRPMRLDGRRASDGPPRSDRVGRRGVRALRSPSITRTATPDTVVRERHAERPSRRPATAAPGRPSRRVRPRRTSCRSAGARRRPRPSSGIPGRPAAASGRWPRPRAPWSTARRQVAVARPGPSTPASVTCSASGSAVTARVAIVTSSSAEIVSAWAASWSSTREPTMSVVVSTDRMTAAAIVATMPRAGRGPPPGSRRDDDRWRPVRPAPPAAGGVAARAAAAATSPAPAGAAAAASGRGTPWARTEARVRSRRSSGGSSRTAASDERGRALEPDRAPRLHASQPARCAGDRLGRGGVAGHQPLEPVGLGRGQLELFARAS